MSQRREKIVNALKEKAHDAGAKASAAAKDKVSKGKQKIKDVASDKKKKAVGSILNKGIDITEKQLETLKDIKRKKA